MKNFTDTSLTFVYIFCCILGSWGANIQVFDSAHPLKSSRSNCGSNAEAPPTRIDTTERVNALLKMMEERGLAAYIIPTADEHQSEYVSEYDERREYITGFRGSAGTAVVLKDGQRALWTDGRYFLAADLELDCNWILMRSREKRVPKMNDWLKQNLKENDNVGIDPKLMGAQSYEELEKYLKESKIVLQGTKENLVDLIWPDSLRTPKSDAPIEILGLKYAGKRWQDKAEDIRAILREKGADMTVITALDEVAWLFNLRGRDIPYTPVFRSYAIVSLDRVHLFLDTKVRPEVDLHLHVNDCEQECVEVHSYKSIVDTLRGLSSVEGVKKVILPAKLAYDGGASYAIVSAVAPSKRSIEVSPLLYMKAIKNDIERQGMRNAHLKDAVALIDFLSLLDEEIPAGKDWTELSAAAKLEEMRRSQVDNRGLSFETISAFGSNGAIIHYTPVESTNKKITDESLYLLDSGGQYKDGTTDVTRTLHYGTPTPFQIEAYTRVLKGAIDLAMLKFPNGTLDTRVDILARRSLFDVGLDYKHGTGHGIGMFSFIHESPVQIRVYGSTIGNPLQEGYFFSDEPGYYKDGDFGIRLETILTIVKADTKYKSSDKLLAFEPVTLVPFERKLIDVSLLSQVQCKFVNKYHKMVLDKINPRLLTAGLTRASKYLVDRTTPLDCGRKSSSYQESAGPSRNVYTYSSSQYLEPIFSLILALFLLGIGGQ